MPRNNHRHRTDKPQVPRFAGIFPRQIRIQDPLRGVRRFLVTFPPPATTTRVDPGRSFPKKRYNTNIRSSHPSLRHLIQLLFGEVSLRSHRRLIPSHRARRRGGSARGSVWRVAIGAKRTEGTMVQRRVAVGVDPIPLRALSIECDREFLPTVKVWVVRLIIPSFDCPSQILFLQ